MTEHPPLTIGPCSLYCGDAMALMPALIAQGFRADLLVCDPPYELTSGGCTEGGLHERFGDGSAEGYKNSGNLFEGEIPDWQEFMPLFYQILADQAHCYTMADSRNQFDMQVAARAAGFKHHNLLRWNKKTATPNRWYMKNDEFTGFFYKGKAFAINDCGSMAGVDMSQVDVTRHPTEKPVPLMQHYIENSSRPAQLVLDPFMGTGTTGVAAVRAGRRFVGIERDERWFAAAVKRIEEAVRNFQPALF